MCNYHPNSQFNSHNRTAQAVTPQQKPPMEVHICKDRTDEARRVIFKKPCGADIRQLIYGGGIKTTVGETLLMCLTVASGLLLIRYWVQPPSHHFFLFFFTAVQSTGYNCTHTEENKTRHTNSSKGRVLIQHTVLQCKYKHWLSSYSTNTVHLQECMKRNVKVSEAMTAASLTAAASPSSVVHINSPIDKTLWRQMEIQ